MQNTPVIQAVRRDRVGTRYAARVRASGRLPAIVYGHKQDPVPISVDTRTLMTHVLLGEKLFQLELDGEAETVLIKDLQYNHLGTHPVHCDLERVSLTERIDVAVPVRFVGSAVGLKTAGAVMVHPTTSLEIECVVSELPDNIEVDVSALEAGQTLTAASVVLPPSMKLRTDPHAVLAQIAVQVVTETAEAAEVPAEGATEPEVITEKKKDEEES